MGNHKINYENVTADLMDVAVKAICDAFDSIDQTDVDWNNVRFIGLSEQISGEEDLLATFERLLEETSDKVVNCECGIDKVGGGHHSGWCPKFKENK